MNAVFRPPGTDLSLVDVVQLKWLLSAEGVHLHVERMLAEPPYAHEMLDRAEASTHPMVRALARQLRTPERPAAAA